MQIHSPRKTNKSTSCFPKSAILISRAFCAYGMWDYAVFANYYLGCIVGYSSLA